MFGPHLLRTWSIDFVFPNDFDIFSPFIVTIPTCIQILAKLTPEKDSDCAISFSWWGNIRSRPPPWISKLLPRYFKLIAEHSMCHPGLPLPHGLFHVGESSENFHNAKSRGSFFVSSTSTRAPEINSSIFFFESFPYSLNFKTEKYTPFLDTYANPLSTKPLIK